MAQFLVIEDFRIGGTTLLSAGSIVDDRFVDFTLLTNSGMLTVPYDPGLGPVVKSFNDQRDLMQEGSENTLPTGILRSTYGARLVRTTSGQTVQEILDADASGGTPIYSGAIIFVDPSMPNVQSPADPDFPNFSRPFATWQDAASNIPEPTTFEQQSTPVTVLCAAGTYDLGGAEVVLPRNRVIVTESIGGGISLDNGDIRARVTSAFGFPAHTTGFFLYGATLRDGLIIEAQDPFCGWFVALRNGIIDGDVTEANPLTANVAGIVDMGGDSTLRGTVDLPNTSLNAKGNPGFLGPAQTFSEIRDCVNPRFDFSTFTVTRSNIQGSGRGILNADLAGIISFLAPNAGPADAWKIDPGSLGKLRDTLGILSPFRVDGSGPRIATVVGNVRDIFVTGDVSDTDFTRMVGQDGQVAFVTRLSPEDGEVINPGDVVAWGPTPGRITRATSMTNAENTIGISRTVALGSTPPVQYAEVVLNGSLYRNDLFLSYPANSRLFVPPTPGLPIVTQPLGSTVQFGHVLDEDFILVDIQTLPHETLQNQDVYVSAQNGDDDNAGTDSGSPLATLTRAAETIPKTTKDFSVVVHAGLHALAGYDPPAIKDPGEGRLVFIGDGAGQPGDTGKQAIPIPATAWTTVSARGAGTANAVQGGVAIMTPNQYRGKTLELAPFGPDSVRRTIIENTADTFVLSHPLDTGLGINVTIQVFEPTINIRFPSGGAHPLIQGSGGSDPQSRLVDPEKRSCVYWAQFRHDTGGAYVPVSVSNARLVLLGIEQADNCPFEFGSSTVVSSGSEARQDAWVQSATGLFGTVDDQSWAGWGLFKASGVDPFFLTSGSYFGGVVVAGQLSVPGNNSAALWGSSLDHRESAGASAPSLRVNGTASVTLGVTGDTVIIGADDAVEPAVRARFNCDLRLFNNTFVEQDGAAPALAANRGGQIYLQVPNAGANMAVSSAAGLSVDAKLGGRVYFEGDPVTTGVFPTGNLDANGTPVTPATFAGVFPSAGIHTANTDGSAIVRVS